MNFFRPSYVNTIAATLGVLLIPATEHTVYCITIPCGPTRSSLLLDMLTGNVPADISYITLAAGLVIGYVLASGIDWFIHRKT